MWNFISKLFSNPAPKDFSRLHTDLHSHLLPGLDDGVQTMDEALEVVEMLGLLGYKRLITTPHVMADRYPNTVAQIREGEKALQAAVRKEGIPVEVFAAAEYYMDDQFAELVAKDELLPLDAGRHLLVELSFHHEPLALRQILFDLQSHHYKPVLAHPERYPYYHNKPHDYKALVQAGCKMQVNILSITGHYGPDVQKAAQTLLKNGLVDFLGTDAHRTSHARTLSAALRSGHLEKTLQQFSFTNEQLDTRS